MRGLRLTLAMRLALLYALIGGLWILLSDRAVAAVVKDPADLTLVQTYKGWLFVAATSLLLFVYLVYENKRRQATERDYRNIFEHAVEGIFQSTLEGRFISVNPAMARIYGYDSPEEMIAAISDIGEQIQASPKRREQLVTTLLQDGFAEKFETQSRYKDGRLIWTSINARLVRDENEAPLYIEGFVTDITSHKLAEAALREAEIRYRSLVEQIPAAVYTDTADNNLNLGIYVSPQIEAISGYPPEDWTHTHGFLRKIIHPDDYDKFVQENERTNASGEPFDIEYRITACDGHIVWIHDMARLVYDEEGNPLYWQGLMVDVSESKLTEQKIKASEDQYRRLVEHLPYAVAIHSEGRLLYINQAGVKLIGARRAEELQGRAAIDFVHPDSRPKIVKRFEEMGKGHEVPALEEKFIRLDGSVVAVETIAYSFNYQGKPAIQVVIRDLTEQKQAEEALRASEERLRAIVDHTENVYYSHTPDHLLTYLSAQTKAILGYEPEEALISWREFLTDHPINQRGIQLSQKALDTGLPQEPYILELKAKDGRHVWAEVRETPVVRDGKTVAMVGALTDITKRKEAEEDLERRLAELTVLHAIAIAGAEGINEDDVIQRATQIVSGMLYPDNCGVLLLNEAGNLLTAHPSYWGASPEIAKYSRPLSVGISGQVAATGQTVRADDVTKIAAYLEVTTGIHSELCVPIRVNEKVIGVLNVESRKLNAFDEEDERLLNTIAGTLGTAIERIRLFAAEQKQRQQAEDLRETTAALTRSIELETLYKIILDSLAKLVPYVSASIEIVEQDSIEIVAAHGLPQGHQFIGRRSLLQPEKWKVDILRPIIIPDVGKDDRFEKIEGTEYIRSWMGVPMLAEDQLIGYLNLDSDQVDFYTQEQAAILAIFANQAATAIQNARRFRSEQKRRKEAENLQVAATALTSSLKAEDVLETILVALKQVAPYDSASVLLLEGNQVRIRAGKGLPNPNLALNQLFPAKNGLLAAILKRGEAVIIEDAQQDSRFEKWGAADNVRGWLGVPLIARGQIIGYITLDSYTPGAFDQNDALLAQAFAHQAAAAIDTANLFQSLQETNRELSRAYDTTLEGWGKALELRDKETQGHTQRVTELTLKLAQRIGIPEPDLTHVRRGVLVHDIGKMGVPDEILHKKKPLTKKEWEEMRRHPQYAYELLYPIAYLRPALDIAYCHHERWDGTGYPRGLEGEEIPLAARVFAVVDVWDALLSDRHYRKAWPRKKVLRHIREQSGAHFDPRVVDVFLQMLEDEKMS